MAKQKVEIEVRASDAASGVFAKVGNALDRLKQQAGARGPIKDVFELLKGGGAIVGLSFGANVLKDMADEAVKLRDAFNAGQISVGQLTEKLIAAVPVIGTIRQAGLAIRELFTGELAAAKQITDEAERVVRIIDLQNVALKKQNEERLDHLKAVRQLNFEIGQIGMAEPGRSLGSSLNQQTLDSEKVVADFNKKIADAKADSQKTLAELSQQTADSRNKIPGPFNLSIRQAIHLTDAEEKELRDKRDADIAAAQAIVTANIKKERDEKARGDQQILELERQKQEQINLIYQKGLKDRAEILMSEGKKAADAEIAARLKASHDETEKVLEQRRNQSILIQQQVDQQFGNLDDSGGTNFDPRGGEFLQQAMNRNRDAAQKAANPFASPSPFRAPGLAPTIGGSGAAIAFQTSLISRNATQADDTKAIRKASEETAKRQKEHTDAIKDLARALRQNPLTKAIFN